MMVKKRVLTLLFLSIGFIVKAQESAHFSQGIFNQAFVNPAYAGSARLFQATGVARMEMTGFEGNPKTTLINVNGPIDVLHGGVNLSVYNSELGYYKTPGVNIGYAFRFPLWKGSLSFGLSGGFISASIDNSNWRQPDGGSSDPAIPTKEDGATSPDFGFGAYYNDDKLFIGLSCMHLLETKITKTNLASKLPRVYYIMAGYRILLGDPNFEIRPSLYVSTDLSIAHYTANAHVFYRNKLWGGVSYRLNEAIVGTVGFELFGGVKVGYSYDFITTKARKGAKGSHELLVSYSFTISTEKKKQQYRSVRYL